MYRMYIPKVDGFSWFYEEMMKEFVNRFNGVNVTECSNYSVGFDGYVREEVIVYEVLALHSTLNTEDIVWLAETFKETLRLECVLWHYINLDVSRFV